MSTVFLSLCRFSFARVGHIGPPLHVLSMMERRPLESWGVAAPPPCRMVNAGLCDYKKKTYPNLPLVTLRFLVERRTTNAKQNCYLLLIRDIINSRAMFYISFPFIVYASTVCSKWVGKTIMGIYTTPLSSNHHSAGPT